MPYKNPEDKKQYIKKYYQKHRQKLLQYATEYRLLHKEKIQQDMKDYHEKNKKQLNKKHQKYFKIRMETDVSFKLKVYLRIRLGQAIKKSWKAGSAVKDLGCSVDELKRYLGSKFSSNMSWDNYGSYWEIDHIKPLSSFDLTDREQFLTAANYTNLQPLSIEDHKKKSANEKKKGSK